MGLTRITAGQISNIDYKQAVRVITLSNITLSGGAPTVVDGVTLVLADRILVAGQSTGSQNGLYYVTILGTGADGTWSRTIDADATGEVAAGMIVMVTEGTTYKDSQWKLTTNNPIVVGTTALTFEQNSAFAFGNVYANGTAVIATTVGDTLTLTAGTNIQIIGNISAKSVTIAVTGLSLNSISNGTSNVNVVSSGGNVTVGVGGTSNVAVFSSSGANITGTLGVTGNITGGNVSGTTVSGTNGTFTANVTTGNVSGTTGAFTNVSGTLTTAAQTNITSVGTLTSLAVTGNITGGNLSGTSIVGTLTTAAQTNITSVGTLTSLAVTGNITSGNIQGTTHSGTTGTFTGNVTTGNVSGTTGAFTNVGGTLTTAAQTGITSVGTLTSLAVTGNITGGNLSGTSIVGTITTAAQTNITSVGNLTGLTVSNVSGLVNFITTANVSLGNVSNLHITGGSNNQVLTTNGSGGLSWTTANGNVIIDSFTGNGSQTIFTLSTTPTSNNFIQVNINGITQLHDAFTVSGANVTMSAAPNNGSSVEMTTFNLGGGGGGGGTSTAAAVGYSLIFGG